MSTQRFRTRSLHAGTAPDPATGAILTPIHQSTTYRQAAVGEDLGFTYTRAGNPTVAALEARLGALEEAPPAVATSTGMAALTALLLATVRAGERIVVGEAVYGGTVRLVREVLAPLGVEADFVDSSDLAALAAALEQPAKLVLVETPANPTLVLTDIAQAARLTRAAGALFAVDNTFLTAALQRPLELGAHISVYSTTKFIEGHNATVGGAVVTRDEGLLAQLRRVVKTVGCPQSPLEAWLTLRGIGTLDLRVRQHSRNAAEVARHLERHPAVACVHHPDLESFPQRALARRQQEAGGGVLAFELCGDVEAGVRVMNALELCALAENLGAVETLVTHPASMTHGDVPAAQRRAAGIHDGLVRLSVGLEDPRDVIADLDRALEVAAVEEVSS